MRFEFEKPSPFIGALLIFNVANVIAASDTDIKICNKGIGDESISSCTQLINSGQLGKQSWAAYFSRGDAWKEKGDYDKAIADYTEALRIDPQLAIAYTNRGDAWKKKGDTEKANADYNEALRLTPQQTASKTSVTSKRGGSGDNTSCTSSIPGQHCTAETNASIGSSAVGLAIFGALVEGFVGYRQNRNAAQQQQSQQQPSATVPNIQQTTEMSQQQISGALPENVFEVDQTPQCIEFAALRNDPETRYDLGKASFRIGNKCSFPVYIHYSVWVDGKYHDSDMFQYTTSLGPRGVYFPGAFSETVPFTVHDNSNWYVKPWWVCPAEDEVARRTRKNISYVSYRGPKCLATIYTDKQMGVAN